MRALWLKLLKNTGLHSTMSEILAPAGNKNCAIAAINSGADAIYLGMKAFSARSSAENFDSESLKEICAFAHSFGVKVYVALNTLIKDGELDDFFAECQSAHNSGADALIISDIYLGAKLKEFCPQISVHLSTQAGVCNEYGARLAKSYGFERVVLARETAFEDIKAISKIIETEVFVQGALCTCFSGQCYLSSFAGGYSGNRGQCKQPCRKTYTIDTKGCDQPAYRLSLSDLSVGEDIKKLQGAGVSSFKIEGRMRRAEYVAAAVKYCKNCLSGGNSDGLSDLKRTFNRGNYTRGLAFGQDKSFISSAVQGHIGEFVGVVTVKNGRYFVGCASSFRKNDSFKILRDGKEVGGAYFDEAVRGGFYINSRTRLKNGDKAFVTTDTAVNERLLSVKRSIKVKIFAKFKAGERAELEINGLKVFGDSILQPAKNSPLTAADVEKNFKKTDKYPFEVEIIGFETDGVFMPASELNALRRKTYAQYFDFISESNNVNYNRKIIYSYIKPCKNGKIAVICTDLRGITADIGILKIPDFSADITKLTEGFCGEKFLYLPPYLTGAEIEKAKTIAKNFDGVYSDGIHGFLLAEELKVKFFAGCGLNISNSISVLSCRADYVALSKEITIKEAEALSCENTFYLSAGDIKVMDLIYCPFGKKCVSCENRDIYTLTDENGRQFTLRRYKTGDCRFEIYNGASLVGTKHGCGALIDCTTQPRPDKIINNLGDENALKALFNQNFTRGHTINSVK